ncbi:MAG TPA: patatin-like phospholipase family protein [Blastocatellia bacterium]|nr:patatin-like phospholipase family protein [Blastocatellia bacterium]
MAYPFTNLVFEGGGVKGVAYVGSLAVLEKRGILEQTARIGGTSAGAITAALVALNYSADETRELMLNLDFKQFKDGSFFGDIERFFKKYGWYKGDAFLKWIEQRVKEKTGSPDTTFNELMQMKGFKQLYVVGTNLSTRDYQVFSHESTGDVRIADAVRISMSIPLFFASRQFRGDVFVDGGVLNNYPITLFDNEKYVSDAANIIDGCVNLETLGFHLGKHITERHEINDLDDYAGNLFETILDVQDNALWNSPNDLRRTVCIDNLGIQTTDFNITTEQKLALIKQGHEATANYLRAFEAGLPSDVCDNMPRDRRSG